MNWKVVFLPEAMEDFRRLDGSQKILVRKAINKVSINPLPTEEGGYGKPLGNKGGRNLTGLYKIKLLNAGIRIVYKLIRKDGEMCIVVIAARKDEEVYDLAAQRQ